MADLTVKGEARTPVLRFSALAVPRAGNAQPSNVTRTGLGLRATLATTQPVSPQATQWEVPGSPGSGRGPGVTGAETQAQSSRPRPEPGCAAARGVSERGPTSPLTSSPVTLSSPEQLWASHGALERHRGLREGLPRTPPAQGTANSTSRLTLTAVPHAAAPSPSGHQEAPGVPFPGWTVPH